MKITVFNGNPITRNYCCEETAVSAIVSSNSSPFQIGGTAKELEAVNRLLSIIVEYPIILKSRKLYVLKDNSLISLKENMRKEITGINNYKEVWR